LLSVASQLQSSSLKLTVSRFRLSCHSAIVKVLPIRKPMPALPSIGPGNLIFSDQSCPLGILLPLCGVVYYTILSCQVTCFCVQNSLTSLSVTQGMILPQPIFLSSQFRVKRL